MHVLWNTSQPRGTECTLIVSAVGASAGACAFALFRMHVLWNVLQSTGIESMPSVPARGAGTDARAMECVAASNDFSGQ